MRKLTMGSIIAAAVVLLAILAWAPSARCAEPKCNPWVATFDAITGEPKDIFELGEAVNITAYSGFPLPYDIIVTDSEDEVRFTDESTEPRYSRIIEGITDIPGWWHVEAGTVNTHFALAWYNVIPEAPLGVVSILTACFAGFGIMRLRKRK